MEYKILSGKKSFTLKQLRQARGVTQTALARVIGISSSTLSRLEKRKNPKFSSIARFVQALGGTMHV